MLTASLLQGSVFRWAACGEAKVSPVYTQAGASGKDWLTSVTFAIYPFTLGR